MPEVGPALVLVLQASRGESDKFLPNIKLIIRLSPTRDVATDGTFTTRDGGQWFGNGYKTPKELRHVLELWEATIKSGTMKHLVSMTHGIFLNENIFFINVK